MWTPDIGRLEGPRYLAIASAIASAIETGDLPPGAQLPPHRDLADRLGVTVGTVTRAYALARDKKLITGEVGRGTFVKAGRSVAQRLEFRPPAAERTVDLSCYRAPKAGLGDIVSASLASLAQRVAFLPLQKYPPAAGLPAHRNAVATWLNRTGLSARPEDVLLCGGAQQGLQIALLTVASSGDTVLTDALTYSGLKALAALGGVRLVGVQGDDEGMMPDALRAAALATGAGAVFLQTTLHNPTTSTMSLKRRHLIAAVAREAGLLIVEDDVAAGILSERPIPLAALHPEHSIYITGLAKSLSPAFRAGFVLCPPSLHETMSNTLHATTLGLSPILGELVADVVSHPAIADVLERARDETAKRVAIAHEILGTEGIRSHPASVHLWVPLPPEWRALEFEAAARRNGVAVVAADNFATDDTRPPSAVRVSLSPGSPETLLARGLTILKRLMAGRPVLGATIV